MNNFSPSTDTSVGTKRFTAQEVQLAYTLMAVEYMKTIKGLNPNHQLVDKAVKLKALGFTNSKEVGDAITSEEDLKVLKCYSFLQRHFPGSLILKEEDFINLNVKYGLVVGRLSAYKGSVPDENIDEISKVMATATNIEVLMESRLSNNLVTLTAPVNKDAKNLFKWPNNFAWTYNGGVADSIKEKVRAAGGQTEGFLRCSLAWSNYDDLDLHVVEPNNLEIYYSNRIGRSGGKLDVDENAGYGKTRKPVENIIWVNERKMLEGKYVVYVNNFHCRESVDTGFTLEIEHNGEVRQFVYDKPVKHKENVMVAEITYSKSKGIQIRELTPHRKVFEVLADKMKTPYQEHQLSGLGFSSTMRNSVIVKVDGTFSRTLKVNF